MKNPSNHTNRNGKYETARDKFTAHVVEASKLVSLLSQYVDRSLDVPDKEVTWLHATGAEEFTRQLRNIAERFALLEK